MPLDGRGVEFTLGCKVARATKYLQTDGVYVKECTVSNIIGEKVYLDGSKVPLKFADRVMIIML